MEKGLPAMPKKLLYTSAPAPRPDQKQGSKQILCRSLRDTRHHLLLAACFMASA